MTPRPEAADARLLIAAVLTVPLTWLLILGWRPGLLISGHDGAALFAPFYRELFRMGGDWTRWLYRPGIMGGLEFHDACGTLPSMQILAMLGLSVVAAMNLTTFFIQICFSFLCGRASLDFAGLWRDAGEPRPELSWPQAILFCWLTAFSPLLAWRLGYGHEAIVLGCFAFLAALSLCLRIRSGRVSHAHACVVVAALAECFPSLGPQMVLYSVVFGGPICLALLPRLDSSHSRRSAAAALLLVLSALGISMPKFAGMLAHALGPDTGRRLGGEPVTYIYITSSLRDWAGSIPWGRWLIPGDRPVDMHHEVNYPLGPLLLLLLPVPWRKMRALAILLPAVVLLAIGFSMNVHPLAAILLKLVPPLNSFRVPARAILPAACLVPVLGCAVLLRPTRGGTRIGWASPAGGLLLGVALLHAGGAVRESASWCAAALVAVHHFFRGRPSSSRFRPALSMGAALFLGVMSLSFFAERLPPYAQEELLTGIPDKLGALIKAKDPSLESPLARVLLENKIDVLSINTAFASGLSSLDGYGHPLRRYAELISATSAKRLPLTSTFIHVDAADLEFPVLRKLYNVKFAASLKGGLVKLEPLGPTAGPAWFPDKLEPVKDFAELGRRLMALRDSAADEIARDALIVNDDPSARAAPMPKGVFGDPRCARSKVGEIRNEPNGQTLRVKVLNPSAACPLVISENFIEAFEASDVSSGAGGSRLATFPVYGTLTGIWVPAGVEAIRLRPVPVLPLWSRLAQVAGLLAFAAGIGVQRLASPD